MSLPPDLSGPALLRLWDVLPGARVVGGAVRDCLAGRPVADIDLATPQRPEAVMEALTAARIRVIPTGLAHGTVTALLDREAFEVTTLRRDVTTDGRHAVVTFTDDWHADAARRDFTFNAMSMDRAGAIFDYFDGCADLRAGRVRFVGDARTRIAEDYLRVLRFFRFFARYGDADPDAPTGAALGEADLSGLSAERVWSELRRILSAPEPGRAITLMRRLGVLARVVPGPLTLDRFDRLLEAGAPADPLLRLAGLSGAAADDLVVRYRMSSADADRLDRLRRPAPPEQADERGLRRDLTRESGTDLIDRAWLDGRSDALRARIAALPEPVFPLHGRDLLAVGMAPGREMGRHLAELRRAWEESGGLATRDELLAKLAGPSGG